MSFILKGIILGFSVAAPVGPIGILCINRTLRLSRLHGFLTGIGAATADALYGVVAGFGLTAISDLFVNYQSPIRLVGGAFLLYLGWKTIVSKPTEQANDGSSETLRSTYFSALALTVTNPMTILSFAAAFAALGLGLGTATTHASALSLISGVFLGSALWWICLSTGTGALRNHITLSRMQWINRLSGATIVLFGLIALVTSFGP